MCKYRETCYFGFYQILLFCFCIYELSISFYKKTEKLEIKKETEISIKIDKHEEKEKKKINKIKFLTKPKIVSYETDDADTIWFEK